MGEIYKAQDTRLNRAVAVKVLNAAQAGEGERRRRFLQEAQAASALNHPNIITIHDIVSEGETEFLVMEFVAGKTLADLIPVGGLAMPLVLAYGLQIADALEAAHGAGIVHRDLKPGNVMVTASADGRPGLVKLLDFGLAKWTSPNTSAGGRDETATLAQALTVEGSILGTVSYMSPEQAEGKPVDGRSDIFAFGAIVYEMVTGLRAFGGDTPISAITSILRDEVRPLTQTTAGVPPALQNIVWRCLRKNREERWQSIGEVRAALAMLKRDSDSGSLIVLPAVSSAAAPAPAPTMITQAPVPPAAAPKKKVPVLVALLASVGALVVLTILGMIVGIWLLVRDRPRTHPPHRTPVASAPAATPAATPGDGVLTNQDIVKLVNADVPVKVIIDQIHASKTRFDLSASAIIQLHEGDVPTDVISAMQAASRILAPRPTVVKATPAPAGGPKPEAVSPAAPAPPPAPTIPPPQMVAVLDRLPIPIRLTEDVPADVAVGTVLHFKVMKDFHMHGTVVVEEGATVTGEIVEAAHKKVLGAARPLFRLKDVDTTGGGKLALRASPGSRGDDGRRTMEPIGAPHRSKELAAAAGDVFLAYVDGEQSVAARK